MLGRAPLPVFETQLCQFCAFIADQGLSHQTIKCYLSAIRFHQIFSGLPDPGISNMVRLEQLLKGIKSVQARLKKNQRPRLPITPSILKCMKAVWIPTSNLRIKRDNKMLWAACTLCFFGFFRVGELMSSSTSSYDPETQLTFRDIAIDNVKSPTLLQVHLKASKTDPFREGVDVYVGKSGNDIYPISAMSVYLSSRGGQDGPLFLFEDGTFLTKDRFVSAVREALKLIGIDPSKYSGHSFRRGAATTAQSRGISDVTIKMLGRWKSSAYTRYIQTPRSQLAAFSSQLA